MVLRFASGDVDVCVPTSDMYLPSGHSVGLPCGLALCGAARLPCGDVVWKKIDFPCGRHTQRVPNFKGSDPVCCLRETDLMNRSAATAARFGCVSVRLNEPLRGNHRVVWMCRSATYLSEI